MAVYEGARPRTIALPRRPRVAEAPDARTSPGPGAFRAGRRTTGSGASSAAIVVVFMLAFFSLAQQVRVSATGIDIGRLNWSASGWRPPRGGHLRPEPAGP